MEGTVPSRRPLRCSGVADLARFEIVDGTTEGSSTIPFKNTAMFQCRVHTFTVRYKNDHKVSSSGRKETMTYRLLQNILENAMTQGGGGAYFFQERAKAGPARNSYTAASALVQSFYAITTATNGQLNHEVRSKTRHTDRLWWAALHRVSGVLIASHGCVVPARERRCSTACIFSARLLVCQQHVYVTYLVRVAPFPPFLSRNIVPHFRNPGTTRLPYEWSLSNRRGMGGGTFRPPSQLQTSRYYSLDEHSLSKGLEIHADIQL